MRKLRVPLYPFSMAALATLAACGGYESVTPAPGAVVTAPGAAVVTTPAPAPAVVASPPAAVTTLPGTTAVVPGTVAQPGTAVVVPPTSTAGVRPGVGRIETSTRLSEASGLPNPLKRYGVRMDDGAVQFFDTRAPNLSIGDRVELTADNHIRYPM